MALKHLVETFHAWKESGDRLVLGTVYETAGSTYSKSGSRVLIDGEGNYQGLVSGGCLEGDLAEHAASVLESGERAFGLLRHARRARHPVRHRSGLRRDAEGAAATAVRRRRRSLGAACADGGTGDGLTRASRCAVVVEGDEAPVGATFLDDEVPAEHPDGLHTLANPARKVLVYPLKSIPRLLVLGAGVDAVPLVEFAERLGWRVTVCDHRRSYLERGDLAAAESVLELRPERVTEHLDLDAWDACVVMSHHLASDRAYLAALADRPVPWVGVLGPRARRERLLRELGDGAGDLQEKLRGPVGLDIGANDPGSIALSIMAELTERQTNRTSD